MTAFEQLLQELQVIIKDAHKEGSYEKAMEISEKLKAFAGAQAQTAYVVNISDQRFHVPRSYYNIWVEPCGENEKYKCTEVNSVVDQMDMGLGTSGEFNPVTHKRGKIRTVPIPFSAEQIANDIARQINGNIAEDAFVGVFVSLTPVPSKADLDDAKKRFRKFQEKCVHNADMAWAMKSDYRMIPDFARRSLRELGWTREWYEPVQQDWIDCPACGSKIRPGLAKCPQAGCGAILDAEKAIKFGIALPDHMMPKAKKAKEAQPES